MPKLPSLAMSVTVMLLLASHSGLLDAEHRASNARTAPGRAIAEAFDPNWVDGASSPDLAPVSSGPAQSTPAAVMLHGLPLVGAVTSRQTPVAGASILLHPSDGRCAWPDTGSHSAADGSFERQCSDVRAGSRVLVKVLAADHEEWSRSYLVKSDGDRAEPIEVVVQLTPRPYIAAGVTATPTPFDFYGRIGFGGRVEGRGLGPLPWARVGIQGQGTSCLSPVSTDDDGGFLVWCLGGHAHWTAWRIAVQAEGFQPWETQFYADNRPSLAIVLEPLLGPGTPKPPATTELIAVGPPLPTAAPAALAIRAENAHALREQSQPEPPFDEGESIVGFTRDGSRMVTHVDSSGRDRLRRVADGSLLLELDGTTHDARDQQISPDGTVLASESFGASGTVGLRSLEDGRILRSHWVGAPISSLGFLSSGRRLAALRLPVHLTMWDLRTGLCERLEAIGGYDVAIRPDGEQLALGNGAVVRLVDPSLMEVGRITLADGQAISDLAYSPDGAMLALVIGNAHGNRYDVEVWRGEERSGSFDYEGRPSYPYAAWSADGGWLAVGSSSVTSGEDRWHELWLWSRETDVAARVAHVPRSQIRALAWSPAAPLLAYEVRAGGSRTTVLFDAESMEEVAIVDAVGQPRFTPDGRFMLAERGEIGQAQIQYFGVDPARVQPASTPTIATPSATPSTPSPTPTLVCTTHTVTLDLETDRSTVSVGEEITVTARMDNIGCAGVFGPYFYLGWDDAQDAIIEARSPQVVRTGGASPGEQIEVPFVLRGRQGGMVRLFSSVSFEVHLGFPGPAYFSWARAEPLWLTVTGSGGPGLPRSRVYLPQLQRIAGQPQGRAAGASSHGIRDR